MNQILPYAHHIHTICRAKVSVPRSVSLRFRLLHLVVVAVVQGKLDYGVYSRTELVSSRAVHAVETSRPGGITGALTQQLNDTPLLEPLEVRASATYRWTTLTALVHSNSLCLPYSVTQQSTQTLNGIQALSTNLVTGTKFELEAISTRQTS